ncbi:hypothetical protein BGW41_003837 [Actinomortierella wolfii]|nr:hypothetical protein BGW41_003837 [Actinomortierella wolfii]
MHLTSNQAAVSPGKTRSLTLNRRKSSFGPLSLRIKNDNECNNNSSGNSPGNNQQQSSAPHLAKSHTIGYSHGANTVEGGGNTHASECDFSPTSPQPNSYYYQHHHQRSNSVSSGPLAPASPTRLSQSFRQPSLASTPSGSNHHYMGLGIGTGADHVQSTAGASHTSGGISFGGGTHFSPSGTPSSTHLNQQINDKTAAAVAALRRSAVRLKGWVPSKKFTFKYSPSAYHDAFWNFVQNEHPDSVVIRFLKARKWNVERAMEMLVLVLEWRITNKLDELAVEDEETLDCKYPGFLYLLKRGKFAFAGHDLDGRTLLYINPSLDDQNLHLANRRLFLYTVEHARMRLRSPSDRLSALVDLTTLAMSDIDLNNIKFIVHAADTCYTELMSTGVLYKAPWIFGRLWKIISPLIEPSNRNRLKIASTRKELEEALGPECLAYLKPGKGPSPHEAAAAFNAESSFLHSKDLHRKPSKDKGKENKENKENKDKEKEHDDSNGHHNDPPSHFDFPYVPPVPGENDLFYQDSEAKHRAITRRKELELTFERLTEVWQGQRELSSASTVIQERDAVGYRLVDAFWQAEPYTRVRSVFHRVGAIQAPEPHFAVPATTTTATTFLPTAAQTHVSPCMTNPAGTYSAMGGQSESVAPLASSVPPTFGSFGVHESSSPSSNPITACQ